MCAEILNTNTGERETYSVSVSDTHFRFAYTFYVNYSELLLINNDFFLYFFASMRM